MKKSKTFICSTWSNFIVNQYTKVDNEYKDKTTIEEFRKLQIDSLELKSEVIKCRKNLKGLTGRLYHLVTHFKTPHGSFIVEKFVNRKTLETKIQNVLPSITNPF
jgi:hypothetical protein